MAKVKWIFIALTLAVALSAQADSNCYTADAESGELKFSGQAEGNFFQGHFREFSVRLCLRNEDLQTAEIEVEVATGSVTVGNRQGDQALHDDELFAAERYPRAQWVSGVIEQQAQGYLAAGELTLRSVSASQPVMLKLEMNGDSWALSGEAVIPRLAFDVGQGEFADPDFISPDIRLEFHLNLEPEL